MTVGFEGLGVDTFNGYYPIAWGKKCNLNSFCIKLFKTLKKQPQCQDDFINLFCRIWNFEKVPNTYWHANYDCWVNLDTNHLYFQLKKPNSYRIDNYYRNNGFKLYFLSVYFGFKRKIKC